MFQDAEFCVEELRLRPGDRVVIYSDGVTDAQDSAGNFYGRVRLRETLEAHREGGAVELHDAIRESVAAFTEGAPQLDEPFPVLGREAKRPWKLHEQGAQPFCALERPEPFLEACHLIAVEDTVMRKAPI